MAGRMHGADAPRVHVIAYPDRKNLVLRWREGKKICTESAKTANRQKAERLAIAKEAELAAQARASSAATWPAVRARYTAEVMPGLGQENTIRTRKAALNHVERVLHPRTVAEINASKLSMLVAAWRTEGLSEATIEGYLGHLKPLLKWAESLELIDSVPRFPKIPRAKGKLMKGRPLTSDEFDLMLRAIPRVLTRDEDRLQFARLLWGLWLGGLRLGEAKRLTWVPSPFCVDLSGRYPRIRMEASAHKGKRDLMLPLTEAFCTWLLDTPKDQRFGAVFEVAVPDRRVGEIISAIGQAAGVEVSAGKFASAHDLRRSFGSRLAPLVKPATLQLLMRHASIETTMKYYVDLDADDVGDELRRGRPKKELRDELSRGEVAEVQGLLSRATDDEEENQHLAELSADHADGDGAAGRAA